MMMKTMASSCAFLLLLLTATLSAESPLHLKRKGIATPTTVWTTPKSGCFDSIPNCEYYHHTACSGAYEAWSRDHCPKYCGFCDPGYTTTPLPCEDTVSCDQYGDDICTNVAYRDWSQIHCRKFCNFCGTTIPTTTVWTTPKSGCYDSISYCEEYGTAMCTNSTLKSWVLDNCPKYCGICNPVPGGPTTPRPCENLIDTCALYGKVNCGGIFLGWATHNCRKYCDLCNSQDGQNTTPPSTSISTTPTATTTSPSTSAADVCVQPPDPRNGKYNCHADVFSLTCIATCNSGYVFENQYSSPLWRKCDKVRHIWLSGPDDLNCVATCASPCQNGGTCDAPNHCDCAPGYTGSQCETPKACVQPANPQHGKYQCHEDVLSLTCVFTCDTGYEFEDKSPPPIWSECDFLSHIWKSGPDVPNCVAICSSPCQNGGTCDAPNHCDCAPGYTGSQCETYFS